MSDIFSAFTAIGGIGIVMAGLAWVAHRARRRGAAGSAIAGAMAAYNEAFNATAYDAFVEVEAQQAVPIPAPDNRAANGKR